MTSPRFRRSGSQAATAWLTLALLASGCSSGSKNPGASGGSSSFGGTTGSGGTSSGGSSDAASSTTPSGGGGSIGSGPGGSSGAGGATGQCSNVDPCGGEAVGTWTVTSSCLTVTGQLNLSNFFGQGCSSAQVTGSLQVSGTWSANADGTYTDNTTTSGNEQIELVAACLSFSGTTITCDQVSGAVQAMGYASVSCTAAAGGGCSCSATVEHPGALGLVSSDPSTSGNFTTASNVITIDSTNAYAHCVSGHKMTWTPQTQSPTTTGTVVFQSSGATGSGGATGSFQGPCDIYVSSGTPCVAAYSTVRLLSSKYSGPLYQIRVGGSSSGTGGTLHDIGSIAGGAFADGPAQDTFCGSSACTISKLYDQSSKGNDLAVAGAGCSAGGVPTPDTESNAKGRSLTLSGHKVYALYMASDSTFGSHTAGGTHYDGYRNNKTSGMPLGTAAQSEYEVVDGKRANAGCCWDFGSAQLDNCSTGGTGAMNTISFGQKFVWGTGAGNGPWFMGDFEGGVWAGGLGVSTTPNPNNPSVTWDYAFGLVKTDTANSTPQYAIRVGDAQSGALTTAYDGKAPAAWNLQGGIVLGIGGDNSNTSYGTFFEGAITAGRPSDATDLAVLQNAQAAGYGK